MRASARSEALTGTGPVNEYRCDPGVDPVLRALCSDEQTPPPNPVGFCVPDEGAFETFAGGAGI